MIRRRLLVAMGMLCLSASGLAETVPVTNSTASIEHLVDQWVDQWVDQYVDRYLEMYPTRATGAGDHRYDRRLDDPSEARLAEWVDWNRAAITALDAALAKGGVDPDAALDARLVLDQARQEVFRLDVLKTPWRSPLYWTGVVSGASVFLLVRDDVPVEERLASLAVRVGDVPRLCRQAQSMLAPHSAEIAAEHAQSAARQASASAMFFREGLARAADQVADEARREMLRARLATSGAAAADALDELAAFFESLAESATGSPRLGALYAESFRLGTGVTAPVAEVLAEAEARLVAQRAATARYCRSIWSLVGDGAPPDDDVAAVRACFARIAEDGPDGGIEGFVEEYRRLAREAEDFARARGVLDLPDGFELRVDRSPSFFAGQAVGGVYPAGPFSPDAATLLYVPTPPADTPPEALAAFFRDFNHHFNVMITPHETVPGHAAQLALAARMDRPVRALFADGVYVEGWGTFSERLMLDLGWGGDGGPLARVAHLKKQLENIARLIVDIRVHTTDVSRDEVLRFVRDEALQDEQFAANMWSRAITTSPQLTTYDLGFRQILALYQAEQERLGDDFDAGAFVRSMTDLGSVPVRVYAARLTAN